MDDSLFLYYVFPYYDRYQFFNECDFQLVYALYAQVYKTSGGRMIEDAGNRAANETLRWTDILVVRLVPPPPSNTFCVRHQNQNSVGTATGRVKRHEAVVRSDDCSSGPMIVCCVTSPDKGHNQFSDETSLFTPFHRPVSHSSHYRDDVSID